MIKNIFKLLFKWQTLLNLDRSVDAADFYTDTYCAHAVDVAQSQLQQLFITAFRHQFECRLQEARLVLEQQVCYVSDALKEEGKVGVGGQRDG